MTGAAEAILSGGRKHYFSGRNRGFNLKYTRIPGSEGRSTPTIHDHSNHRPKSPFLSSKSGAPAGRGCLTERER